MNLIRDYAKQDEVQVFPSQIDNVSFIQDTFDFSNNSTIVTPMFPDITYHQQVLIAFHHL